VGACGESAGQSVGWTVEKVGDRGASDTLILIRRSQTGVTTIILVVIFTIPQITNI
jgi:hypothetical protein